MQSSSWFGVRCLFKSSADGGVAIYEERVTVWHAIDADDAIRLAEAEADDYVDGLQVENLGLAQAYAMTDELASGAEVFSLMRSSPLGSSEYLNAFFDTGDEHQIHGTDGTTRVIG